MTSDDTGNRSALVTRWVTITGTRSIDADNGARLAGLFEDYLSPFADENAYFYIGGALGIDTESLQWLAENSQASLTVVVPCTLADQPATASAAVRYYRQRNRLSGIVELRADALDSAAYHARNRWMVDRSGLVIGFPQAGQRASGTWYTISYASDQNLPTLIVPV